MVGSSCLRGAACRVATVFRSTRVPAVGIRRHPVILVLMFGIAAPVLADPVPQVAARYQPGLDEAWVLAEAGRLPSRPCTRVLTMAVSEMRASTTERQARMEAIQAAEACYVRTAIRFIERHLDLVEAGRAECASLIPGMAVHRASLGESIEALGESRADFDGRIVAEVGVRLRVTCPDEAAVIFEGP